MSHKEVVLWPFNVWSLAPLTAIALTGWLTWINQPQTILLPLKPLPNPPNLETSTLFLNPPTTNPAVLTTSATKPSVTTDIQVTSTAQNNEKLHIWALDSHAESSIAKPEGVEIAAVVTLQQDGMVYPTLNSQVSLPMPDGPTLTATVTTTMDNPNGDYTWRGYLDGYGTDYPIVMTYGATSTFATITTPKGSYTLEIINNHGLIYKNPSEIELSHPDHTDFIDPPIFQNL